MTATARVTITHLCGHKHRVTLHSVGAERKSAEMFDLSARDCPACADELAPRRAAKTEQPAASAITEPVTPAARQIARLTMDERDALWLLDRCEDGVWETRHMSADMERTLRRLARRGLCHASTFRTEQNRRAAQFERDAIVIESLNAWDVAQVAREADQARAQIEQPVASATQDTQAAHQLTWLKREASDVEQNLASLTHTACQIGEASGWRDARLPQIDVAIHYWKSRYLALTRQISAESVRVALALSL